ncbi:MarR family winged helix-turn-helix transcriptional regulator [Aquipuribacter hungaricus]|uniref:MarR family winged helix-turn-helix transcriptional regulator n=2 Tax=Aquipuribacter hungaricus TaxID=545624 RepID=A0ABV7WM36_9MICO
MTDDHDGPLDSDLGWTLGVVLREYLRVTDGVVDDLPGGPRGYQLLAAAAQGQGRNQGALAARLGIDRTVLTYLVDDLEEAGLVLRRPDPVDRRSRLVEATEEGRRTLAGHEVAVARAEQHVLGALPAGDAETFRRLLRTLACSTADRAGVDDMCQVVQATTGGATGPGTTATRGTAGDRGAARGGPRRRSGRTAQKA